MRSHAARQESSAELHLKFPRYRFLKVSLIWHMGRGLWRTPLCEVNSIPTSIFKEESSCFFPTTSHSTKYSAVVR